MDKDEASWVIFETDGRTTVIPRNEVDLRHADAMQDVEIMDELDQNGDCEQI